MKRESLPKTIQIFLLNKEQKEEIGVKLEKVLEEIESDEIEIDWMHQEGMDGRLSDLEDTINIYNLKTIKII